MIMCTIFEQQHLDLKTQKFELKALRHTTLNNTREVDYICMHTYSIDFDSDLVLFLYSHSNVLFD